MANGAVHRITSTTPARSTRREVSIRDRTQQGADVTGPGRRPDDDPGDGGRVADVEAACSILERFLASFDPDRHTVPSVRRVASVCSRVVNLGNAGVSLCAPRLVRSGGHVDHGNRSGAQDLATITGSSVGGARRLLEVGEASASSPGVAEALRGGRLSPERAAIVAKGVGDAPEAEGELLASAVSESLRQLRDRQRHARARGLRREEAAARETRLHTGRRAHTFVDDEGFVRLDARLTPEAGALVKGALAVEADAIFVENRRTSHHEPHAALEADALCRLIERGDLARGHVAHGGPRPRTSPGTSVEPASGHRPGAGTPPAEGTSTDGGGFLLGPRATITLRVDLAALRRGELAGGEVCEIPGVGPVSLATARALMGDALVTLVIARGTDVTTVAHLGRTVPTTLRRALAERDPVCVVPGCGSSWNLEIDHWRVPFADGGPASLENCVVLCRFHHRLRHYQGFSLGGGPGNWRFDPPPGADVHTRPLSERPPPRPPAQDACEPLPPALSEGDRAPDQGRLFHPRT